MSPILSITFLISLVHGDYGDIYQLSQNMSVNNFQGSVILSEIEKSKKNLNH